MLSSWYRARGGIHSIALRRGAQRRGGVASASTTLNTYSLAPELLSQMTLVIVQVLHQLYSLANGGGVAVFLGSIQPHESLSTWQMIFFPLLFNTRALHIQLSYVMYLRSLLLCWLRVHKRTTLKSLPAHHNYHYRYGMFLQMYEYKRAKNEKSVIIL